MKYIVATIGCMVILASVNAQIPASRKLAFTSELRTGILIGQAGNTALLAGFAGFRYKTLQAGIGAGIDYYGIRSIPVFVEVQKSFSRKEGSPFLYAAAGPTYAWTQQHVADWDNLGYKSGLYTEGGAGYRFPINAGWHLAVSGGFSLKKIRREPDVVPFPIIDFYPSPGTFSEKLTYRRWLLKLAVGF